MIFPGSIFYIVTPSYNCARYIDETIHSVVTQAGDFSIHYHVQDGGSTDGTVEKLREWEKRLRSPSPWLFCDSLTFTWDSASDTGMYDAINKGFERLNVPTDGIMSWINADDEYSNHAFSTLAGAFAAVPAMEWFGGAVTTLTQESILYPLGGLEPYPRRLIKDFCCDGENWRMLQQNGMFWKGSLWKKAGPLDSALRFAGDFALWPRFAEHAELVYSPVVLGTFRRRSGQLSSFSEYRTEMESVRPAALREQAMKLSLWQRWTGIAAPSIFIDLTLGGKVYKGERLAFAAPRVKNLLRAVFPDAMWHWLRGISRIVKNQ